MVTGVTKYFPLLDIEMSHAGRTLICLSDTTVPATKGPLIARLHILLANTTLIALIAVVAKLALEKTPKYCPRLNQMLV